MVKRIIIVVICAALLVILWHYKDSIIPTSPDREEFGDDDDYGDEYEDDFIDVNASVPEDPWDGEGANHENLHYGFAQTPYIVMGQRGKTGNAPTVPWEVINACTGMNGPAFNAFRAPLKKGDRIICRRGSKTLGVTSPVKVQKCNCSIRNRCFNKPQACGL